MKTATAVYVCSKCDAQSPKWTGQCLECGSWGTVGAGVPSGGAPGSKPTAPARPAARLTSFSDIGVEGAARTPVGIGEVDRAFGGGIVAGSVTLIGGEPGIGKSTVCLQVAGRVARRGKVVYASGEESPSQVKARGERIGAIAEGLHFLGETEVETVIATLAKERPALAVIDSVQMLRSSEIPSEAGAANQLRGATAKLVEFAKSSGTPLLLIGHVTKDGNVAGPKTLEHLVDTVLSFEGERTGSLRLLRVLKNRFGSTDETGIFEMAEEGLVEISNPSAYLLEERRGDVPGDVVSCVLEGTRAVLVDIQALVRETSFGYPVRRATGIDQARLEMLIAVLGARGGVDLGQHDVYVNVVGGLRLKDPSVDLAVAAALVSAYKGVAPGNTAIWGEVGLAGEVRPVPATEKRLLEASKLGIAKAVAPLPKRAKLPKTEGLEVTGVTSIREAIGLLK